MLWYGCGVFLADLVTDLELTLRDVVATIFRAGHISLHLVCCIQPSRLLGVIVGILMIRATWRRVAASKVRLTLRRDDLRFISGSLHTGSAFMKRL